MIMNKKILVINVILITVSLTFIFFGYLVSNRIVTYIPGDSERPVTTILFLIPFLISLFSIILNTVFIFKKNEMHKIFYGFFAIFYFILLCYSSFIVLALEAFKNFRML